MGLRAGVWYAHLSLHKFFLNKWPCPAERKREAGRGREENRGSAGTCTTAPCPGLGQWGEEKGKIMKAGCQRCGLVGCQGHRGDVVSEVTHVTTFNSVSSPLSPVLTLVFDLFDFNV